MTKQKLAEAFDQIVTGLDRRSACEMPTFAGGRCSRKAGWRVNLHGCEQVNMCGQHKAAWVRGWQAERGHPRCTHCGFVFASVTDAVRITTI